MRNFFIVVVLSLSYLAFSSQSGKKVAIVKIAKGPSEVIKPDGTKAPLKMRDWITEGSIIKTSPKSFVKLSFIDKSTMNIGPKSELKVEKFSKSEAGVVNVLTGKIRSQVTKDYLQMDKEKSKLFVKSKNAVMGVRGTDFMFSTNPKTGNTTTVLFEGSIVFNNLPKGGSNDLEKVVNAGRKIKPGEVSIALKNKPKPTVPAKLNNKQFQKLKKNVNMAESKVKKAKKQKSPVPPGLSGDVVASDSASLKDELKKLVKVDVDSKVDDKSDLKASKGFSSGQDEKPADGVMVHLDTGSVIQPASDAVFDSNTNEWVSTSMGDVNDAGEYIPPQDIDITSDGNFVTETEGGGVALVQGINDIKPVDEMVNFDNAPKLELSPEVAQAVKNDLQAQASEGPAPASSEPDASAGGDTAGAGDGSTGGGSAGDTAAVAEPAPLIPVEVTSQEPIAPVANGGGPAVCANCVPLPTGTNTTNPTAAAGAEQIAPPPPPPRTKTNLRINVR